MGKKIIKVSKLLISILVLMYAEIYYFDLLSLIGVNVSSLSNLMHEILVVILYLIILLFVYRMYYDEINSDFKRFKRRLFPNVLMTIVFFVILTMAVAVSEYVASLLAESFHEKYVNLIFSNIFNKTVNYELIFYIIKHIIIIPFVRTIVLVLGVNKFTKSKNRGVIISGLVASLVYMVNIKGSFLFILFTIIPTFVIYGVLTYIYRNNYNNIWYSIMTFILYSMFAGVLLERIL